MNYRTIVGLVQVSTGTVDSHAHLHCAQHFFKSMQARCFSTETVVTYLCLKRPVMPLVHRLQARRAHLRAARPAPGCPPPTSGCGGMTFNPAHRTIVRKNLLASIIQSLPLASCRTASAASIRPFCTTHCSRPRPPWAPPPRSPPLVVESTAHTAVRHQGMQRKIWWRWATSRVSFW